MRLHCCACSISMFLTVPALDNVLRTHPTIVYTHGVIDNPYYRNPDDNLVSC
jgi:hypothetical protein